MKKLILIINSLRSLVRVGLAVGVSGTALTQTKAHTRTTGQHYSGVSCGKGSGQVFNQGKTEAKPKDADDSASVCHDRYFEGYALGNSQQWQACYDTLRKYIETCPHHAFASHAFPQIGTSSAHLGEDAGSRANYLSWLKSVLYLNTSDPEYFCACVTQISGTLSYPRDTTPGNSLRSINVNLSVIRWLLLNTTCDTPYLWQEYVRTRRTQYEQWQNNPMAYALDTTLPPLSTWGLDTLLAKHFLYSTVERPSGDNILRSVTATPNPAREGTLINFSTIRGAYVKIDLFGVAEERTSWPGFEAYVDPGNRSVPIPLQGLANGSYYARVQTAFGEVQTVKIVKQ